MRRGLFSWVYNTVYITSIKPRYGWALQRAGLGDRAFLFAILGLFATIGLALKTYWYKVKNFFSGSKPDATATVETEQDKPDA